MRHGGRPSVFSASQPTYKLPDVSMPRVRPELEGALILFCLLLFTSTGFIILIPANNLSEICNTDVIPYSGREKVVPF